MSNQHDCFQDLEHLGDTRLDNFHGLAFDSLLNLLNVLLSQLLQLLDIVHAGLEGGKISSHSIFQICRCQKGLVRSLELFYFLAFERVVSEDDVRTLVTLGNLFNLLN